jgi:leucyl aminopeptidase (aminopeptidase T)
MAEDRLLEIARLVMEKAIALKPGERVFIVGNPEEASRLICDAYFQAAVELGGQPLLARQAARRITEMADPGVLAVLHSEPDVVLSISTYKIGKDPRGIHLGYVGRDGKRYDHVIDLIEEDKRSRVASSPGIKMETFLRAMDVDYDAIRAAGKALKQAVEGHSEMRIVTPAGTDITVGLRGRKVIVDDGDIRAAGGHGNLPCGEVFFSPELGTARGRIVFDSVLDVGEECILPSEPVTLEVEAGYVTRVLPSKHSAAVEAAFTVGEERALEMNRPQYAKNAWGVGEVGLGLNPAAEMVADMLEAEKVGGTCHIAIGSNYDHDMPALTHHDMLMTSPRIWVDGEPLRGYD